MTNPNAATHRFDAVIFDLDGVLVDSEPWWEEIRVAFATAHGRRWTEDDRAAVMGPNSLGWARIMRDRLALEMPVDAIVDAIVGGVVACYRERPTPVIDGAVDAVRRIAMHLPVAVASSAHRDVIDAAITALGLDGAFAQVVSSDEVANGKPAPDVYLEAARRMEFAPARCLVVEDSLNGVRAGKAAGMTVVLVPSALVPPAAGAADTADVVLGRLAELDPAAVVPRPDVPPPDAPRA